MSHHSFKMVLSSHQAAWATLLLLLVGLMDVAYGEQPETKQIEQWIAELDDDRYVVRESAQQQLTAANKAALGEVAATASDNTASLESVVRSLRILTDWSVSKDSTLRIAALESLSLLKNRPLEAAQASEILADVREQAAIEEIEHLGGTCESVSSILGNAGFIQIQGNIQIRGNPRALLQYRSQQLLRVTIGAKWKGTDEDFKIITQIPRTHTVSLYSAPVGDAALKHLAKIPNLKRVQIYGTNLSHAALEALREELPESIIIDKKKSAARLGIAGDKNQDGAIKMGGAYVRNVIPGSAAANAGLIKGDIITRINDEQVEDFDMLTKRIDTYQPGDTVELSIVRARKTITIPVTFDAWGVDIQQSKQKTQPRIRIPEPR